MVLSNLQRQRHNSAEKEELLISVPDPDLPDPRVFFGLPDPDPLVRGLDLDPDPDPSIIMQK
jgi:hypothetical protein